MPRERGAVSRAWLALAGYLAASILFFGRGLFGGFTTRYIGHYTTDPSAFMWFIEWWPYAISHGLNPLFTKLVWAPPGTTLAWSTPIPLLAIVSYPIYWALGPVAAYNALCLAAPALAAFSAYLLCRWITRDLWASLLGGFIFGFSAYMLNQLLAHIDLVMVWPIPLVLLLALKLRAGEIRPARYSLALAALVVAQFLIFPELLATMTAFAGLAFLAALAILPHRARLYRMIVPTAAGYLLASAVLSPYLFAMLSLRSPSQSIYPLGYYSADLLNFVVPVETNLLGLLLPFQQVSQHFGANLTEQGVCLTIPLIVIAELWRREHWRTPEGKFVAIMLLVTIVASMGTVLNVLGKPTFPMPWALMARLPFMAVALPIRFTLYVFLVLAIIAASWIASSSASVRIKRAAAEIVILFMLPNLSAGFWTAEVDTPRFFSDGTWRSYLQSSDIVLAVPFERLGTSMLWQATANMGFRMSGGYTSVIPFEFERSPAGGYLEGSMDLPEAGEQIKAYLADNHIGAIVQAENDPHGYGYWSLFRSLGMLPRLLDGITLYSIRPGTFDAYAGIAPENLEARATALRYDQLLDGVDRYVSAGRPVAELSPSTLYQAGGLPMEWFLSSLVRPDYQVLSADNRPAFALGGTYSALKPLATRASADGAEVFYPYPEPWVPSRNYETHSLTPAMLFVFDRDHLAAAAKKLKDSPPPERTTPFLSLKTAPIPR